MKHRKLQKGTTFYGSVTVSSKGQIALPAELRKTLNIQTGDQLLIILREQKDGVNLILKSALDNAFKKYSNN